MMMDWKNNTAYQQELSEVCGIKLPYENLYNQNIMVTGANGLLMSYLVDVLMKMNHERNLQIHITALVRSKEKAVRRFADYLDREEFELLIGDVCQKELLKNRTWDYIVHGAGNSHPRAFATQPVETMKTNLIGTINLLDYAVSQEVIHPVKKCLFLSTGEVYGHAAPVEKIGRGNKNTTVKKETEESRAEISNQEENRINIGWKESTAGVVDSMAVRSCYPESKRAAETLCQSYYQEYDVQAVVARLCYIYGATIQDDNSRADAQFLRKALAGEDIVMKSEGTQIRSYCYLQDAVSAILTLILKGKSGEAYNIANRNSIISIRKYAETMAAVFGVAIKTELPEKMEQKGYSNMQREILDESKLRELGWKPKYSLQTGIEKMHAILK